MNRYGWYVLLAVVALGCKSAQERESEMKEKVGRDRTEKKAQLAKLVVDAKPRLDAFTAMLAAVDKLPAPASLKGQTFDRKAPHVQVDYARMALGPKDFPRLDLLLWYGATVGYDWMSALSFTAKHAGAPESTGGSLIEKDFASLAALTHVILIRPITFVPPIIEGTAFRPGKIQAHAFVFDLRTKQPIGGVEFSAESSATVKFEYKKTDNDAAKESSLHSALYGDFRTKVDAALQAALDKVK